MISHWKRYKIKYHDWLTYVLKHHIAWTLERSNKLSGFGENLPLSQDGTGSFGVRFSGGSYVRQELGDSVGAGGGNGCRQVGRNGHAG